MTIVVTGAQSFIGRRFITLARHHGITVIGIDRIPGDNVDVVVDIRDPAFITAVPENVAAVVHLAAISRDADCKADPAGAFDVNVSGTLNVAQACIERQAGQLVFASTEWVYGEVADGSVQVEDQCIDVRRIDGEYALTKLVGERALALAGRRGLMNVTVLRFGIVYGPRDENWAAVESLFHQVAAGAEIKVGSLASARRFIHVDDIASGIIASLGRQGYEVFNLSADRLITLGEVIEASGRIHGFEPLVSETAPSKPSIRNPDNGKARAQLGWQPAVDLGTGLLTLRSSMRAGAA